MKKGMTLIELLIATALVGIIMIGVTSIDYAIRSSRQSSSAGGLLAINVSGAMMQITRDIRLTAGDTTDEGISGFLDASNKSICFRQDVNNPNSYGDDNWICYHIESDPKQLHRCVNPTPTPPQIASQCNTRTILSTTDWDFYTIQRDASSRLEYIEITLTSRADTGQPEHPISNPAYTLTSRIRPLGLSQ